MIDALLNSTRDRMKKAIEVTQNDLSSVRSGRATTALVDHIVIAAYGGTQRLKVTELSTITTMDAKTLVIAPFDPSIIGEIEKGIHEANAGLTPVIDGDIIRITIPSLSEERRQEYIKLARAKVEGGRIMIRQIRQDAMKDVKKFKGENQVSEDEQSHGEKQIQELTDEMIADLDGLLERKEAELLQV
ncbi:ribosome recycling factor [Candidatus Gottesmanbacteria bacterium]|nr:ribosome recycling factor [Candidatus Gottesmanbacteria bacterium]